jgi:Domain of unknown function (DUF4329)
VRVPTFSLLRKKQLSHSTKKKLCIFLVLTYATFLQSLPQIRFVGLLSDRLGYRGRSVNFSSLDEAGVSAVSAINVRSIALNKEFGGKICRENSNYFYTTALEGWDRSITVEKSGLCPFGSTVVGDYHTHGASPDFDQGGETFSFPMIKGDRSNDIATNHYGYNLLWYLIPPHVGYLGTPSGRVLKYDPSAGNTYRIESDRWKIFQQNFAGILGL